MTKDVIKVILVRLLLVALVAGVLFVAVLAGLYVGYGVIGDGDPKAILNWDYLVKIYSKILN
jgi:hypothetical protein